MSEWENQRFRKFKEEVMNYSEIGIDELYVLINRVTCESKKMFFGRSISQKINSRTKYYRHWIVMLEGSGILEPIPNRIQAWKVIK